MFSRVLEWIGISTNKKSIFLKPKSNPVILERSQHTLSRRMISPQALKVLYRLHDAGFQAYLVGGGVRDALLNQHPKDFDIATNAHPEEISALFRNSRMIGRRFRLVHVHFGSLIIEVATFRAGHEISFIQDPNLARSREDGLILRDNIFGSLEQDVFRRDFTVNALYYNIADYTLIDYVDGINDLKNKIIRIIGDPKQRFREDPVRMLRALRFAAKLQFNIEPETKNAIMELAPLIANVPSARLFDEFLKLFLSGFAVDSFKLLREYKIFPFLFPLTDHLLNQSDTDISAGFLNKALENTDQRVSENKSVTPIFLLASLLWLPVQFEIKELRLQKKTGLLALHEASDHVLLKQQKAFAIPRKITHLVKEIWVLQSRLQKKQGQRAKDLIRHPRFRAAYDFLILRAQSGEPLDTLVNWWSEFIPADEPTRTRMIQALGEKKKRHRRHRKRKDFQEKT